MQAQQTHSFAEDLPPLRPLPSFQVLLFWPVGDAPRVQSLVSRNIAWAKGQLGASVNVFLAHYKEGGRGRWHAALGEAWYADNVDFSAEQPGYKLRLMQAMLLAPGFHLDAYRWVWGLDDDIDLVGMSLPRLFGLAGESGAAIVMPAFTQDGRTREDRELGYPFQGPDSRCSLRHVLMVEVIMPAFSVPALRAVLGGSCEGCLHNRTCWGMDRVWCAWTARQLGMQRDAACAIVDEVVARHRNFKSLPGKYNSSGGVAAGFKEEAMEDFHDVQARHPEDFEAETTVLPIRCEKRASAPSLSAFVFSRRGSIARRALVRGMWRQAARHITGLEYAFALCQAEDGWEGQLKKEQASHGDLLILGCKESDAGGALTRKLAAAMEHFQRGPARSLFMKVDDDAFVAWSRFLPYVQRAGPDAYMGVMTARTDDGPQMGPSNNGEPFPTGEKFPYGAYSGPGYLVAKPLLEAILDAGLVRSQPLWNEDRAMAVWVDALRQKGREVHYASVPGLNYAQDNGTRPSYSTWGSYPHVLHNGLSAASIACLSLADGAGDLSADVSPCFPALSSERAAGEATNATEGALLRVKAYFFNLPGSRGRQACMRSQLEGLRRELWQEHKVELAFERVAASRLQQCRQPVQCLEERGGCFPSGKVAQLEHPGGNGVRSLHGVLGCWCSHYSLLARLQKEAATWDYLMVLEDDAVFLPRFAQSLVSFLAARPRLWSLVAVDTFNADASGAFPPGDSMATPGLPGQLYSISATYDTYDGSHCWLLNPEYLSEVLSFVSQAPAVPSDWIPKLQRPLHIAAWAWQLGGVTQAIYAPAAALPSVCQAAVASEIEGAHAALTPWQLRVRDSFVAASPGTAAAASASPRRPVEGPAELVLLGMQASGVRLLEELLGCRQANGSGCGAWRHTHPAQVGSTAAGAVLVLVVRHPFAALRSLQAKGAEGMDCPGLLEADWLERGCKPREGLAQPPGPPWRSLPQAWSSFAAAAQRLAAEPGMFRAVLIERYEDLVQNPVPALRRIAAAAGTSARAPRNGGQATRRARAKLASLDYLAGYSAKEEAALCSRLERSVLFDLGYHGCQVKDARISEMVYGHQVELPARAWKATEHRHLTFRAEVQPSAQLGHRLLVPLAGPLSSKLRLAVVANYQYRVDTRWLDGAMDVEDIDLSEGSITSSGHYWGNFSRFTTHRFGESLPWLFWLLSRYERLPENVVFLHGDRRSWHADLDPSRLASLAPRWGAVAMLSNAHALEPWSWMFKERPWYHPGLDFLSRAFYGEGFWKGVNLSSHVHAAAEHVVSAATIRKVDKRVLSELALTIVENPEHPWSYVMEYTWERLWSRTDRLLPVEEILRRLADYGPLRATAAFASEFSANFSHVTT